MVHGLSPSPLLLLLVFALAGCAAAFGSLHEADIRRLERELRAAPTCSTEPCGEPLFLSPLIASDPKAARAASRVTGLEHFEGSFSGLITVDEASKNALFFWYMPAIHPPAGGVAPAIMWLQGGPGAPSTYGMFTEIGPVIVGKDGSLTPRNHTWNEKYGLLIVDNPAGVGFSYLGDVAQPVDTEVQVGREMVSFLEQFCTVFPELRQDEDAGLFIAGESYGGKYAPASAWSVVQHNKGKTQAEAIPLRGLIIGDGWSDPAIHVQHYAEMMRGMALLGTAEYAHVQAALLRSSQRLEAGDFVGAFDGWNTVWGGETRPGDGPHTFRMMLARPLTERVSSC
jgi:vitellogenic carboxypeptidase-like protein